MMIRIGKHGLNFFFESHIYEKEAVECSCCQSVLSMTYVHIIDSLIEKGLLEKDYQKLCCTCFFLKKNLGFTHCNKEHLCYPRSDGSVGTEKRVSPIMLVISIVEMNSRSTSILSVKCPMCGELYGFIFIKNDQITFKRVLKP